MRLWPTAISGGGGCRRRSWSWLGRSPAEQPVAPPSNRRPATANLPGPGSVDSTAPQNLGHDCAIPGTRRSIVPTPDSTRIWRGHSASTSPLTQQLPGRVDTCGTCLSSYLYRSRNHGCSGAFQAPISALNGRACGAQHPGSYLVVYALGVPTGGGLRTLQRTHARGRVTRGRSGTRRQRGAAGRGGQRNDRPGPHDLYMRGDTTDPPAA